MNRRRGVLQALLSAALFGAATPVSKPLLDSFSPQVLAGLLKLPVLFIMVLPGTMARVLYPDLERADQVFPTLMFDHLPVGVLGLVLAGLIAALMSSIDSTLNSASTLVTMDFVAKARPELSGEKLMKVGRIVAEHGAPWKRKACTPIAAPGPKARSSI